MPISAREKLTSFLSHLIQKRQVVILGFAREGQSTFETLRTYFPSLPILVLDAQKDKDYLSHLNGKQVIFKTPGIPALLTQIQDAVSAGAYLTSQTDVMFSVFGEQIIAITGTKGKSTASKVMAHMLGDEALFMGNIGLPAFTQIERIKSTSKIVYETSSHQCDGLHASPHIAVFLNLFRDHLDYYASQLHYGEAKKQLFLWQKSNDICIYNTTDDKVQALLSNVKSRKIGFALAPHLESEVHVVNGNLVLGKAATRIVATNEIPLLGEHNILNVMPAVIVAHMLGIEVDQIANRLRSVKPVEKRLESVAVVDGVTFVDDALATIPEATIAALQALGDSVVTLMVGGMDRGQEFTDLGKVIANSSVRHLICFPGTGHKISESVRLFGESILVHYVKNMRDAVKIAKQVTPSGKTVLLSTASASFGLFQDYRDRSAQYLAAINENEK